uniref:Uncharacterized protein n=1 Tax=Anguilla anguilla TaxID=7936 RepID=A0A0E9WZM6_ANGAN
MIPYLLPSLNRPFPLLTNPQTLLSTTPPFQTNLFKTYIMHFHNLRDESCVAEILSCKEFQTKNTKDITPNIHYSTYLSGN